MFSARNAATVVAIIAGPLFAAAAPPAAHAGLAGDSVNWSVFNPTLSNLVFNAGTQTIATAGTVFPIPPFSYSGTVADTTIESGPFGTSGTEGTVPCDCDLITDFTKNLPTFVVDPSTTVPGFTSANLLEPAPNELALNFSGLTITAGQFVLLDAVVSPPIPEPSTLALLGFGLSGLAAIRRRKTARAEPGSSAIP